MFAKKDLVENLSHDLDRARAKRDALASDVTTLNAEITELEARLSEEKERRERSRVAAQIEEIEERLADAAKMFAPVVARLFAATAAAGSVVPRAGELSGFLSDFATEVGSEIDSLVSELRRRAEMARSGEPPVQLLPLSAAPPQPKCDDRKPLLLPAFLGREAVLHIERTDEQRNTAA
jgi:chromosome segregation ATPase